MYIVSANNRQYQWDEAAVRSRLIGLRNAEKGKCWIRKDLKTPKFSRIGRIFWRVAKHFRCLRRFFYKIDLDVSKKILKQLRPQLAGDKDLLSIYKDAVTSFKEITLGNKANTQNTSAKKKKPSFEYLTYNSQGACYGKTRLEKVKKVFHRVKDRQPTGICFNEKKISSHVEGGNCSALALDFIKKYQKLKKDRHINEQSTLSELKELLTEVGKMYKRGGGEKIQKFKDHQAAFNCIEVDIPEISSDTTRAKVQSLANYHDLVITQATEQFDVREHSGKFLGEELKKLPEGSYFLRVIKPKGNKRLEEHGHSMVLIKEKQGFFFYDPNLGVEQVTSGLAKRVFYHLKRNFNKYKISQARFYRLENGS